MKTVILRGPVLTQSGYGVHCRQVARWLLSKTDIDVKFVTLPWGDTPWTLDTAAESGLIGEVLKRAIPDDKASANVSFQLQLPNEWNPKLAQFNVGITAGVETDRCNPEWVKACNTMDTVVVPSKHAKLNLTSTGEVTKPLIVIPEAFSDPIALPPDYGELPTFSTAFNFLVFGQLTSMNNNSDRKNIFNTVKWLCDVFKDDQDVGIIIKTNAGRNTKIDRLIIKNAFKTLISECRVGKFPRIHLLHGGMSDVVVAALYKHPQVKALVALTRGEGYGLPILEAAASGLPVIATGWSGHLDFMNQGKFMNVTYQLTDIHKSRIDNRIFMQGTRWANPSEDDFKKKVTKFRTSHAVPKQWATDLQKKLLETHSFAAIAKHYDEAFGSILC